MSYRHTHFERCNGIGTLRLQRPPVNALDLGFATEIESHLREIEEAGELRALVLGGLRGCFSAGLDLKRIPSYGPDDQRAMVSILNKLLLRLYGFPRPTVAAIEGHVVAGGLVMALACDYRVGSRGPYRLGLTELRLGIPYPAAPLAVVQAELSPAAARNLVLLARKWGPEEALAQGVLDEVLSEELVQARALEVASELGNMPPHAYSRIKRQLRRAALDHIQDVVNSGNDPTSRSWLHPGTAAAAADVLSLKEP